MITDEKIDAAIEKLRVAFGVPTREALVRELVNRFLCWKLPKDFYPDAGISFERRNDYDGPHWPIGTNLFTADQARDMIEHMLKVDRGE